MKIFQRSCAKRLVFVSECKSTTGFYSNKGFLEKLIFEGIFGREGGEMRDGDGKGRRKEGERKGNRRQTECNQACLNCRGAKEVKTAKQD